MKKQNGKNYSTRGNSRIWQPESRFPRPQTGRMLYMLTSIITDLGFTAVLMGVILGVYVANILLFDTGLHWSDIRDVTEGMYQLPQTNGRTNVLLLGKGGPGHEGPDLTDTMLIVAMKADDGGTLISIPRDLWSPTLQDKINSAYYYGTIEPQHVGGIPFASQITMEETGLPIHRTVILDFSVFERMIDLIGGIDITIPQTFTDTEFPIAGKENDLCNGDPLFRCRYETVHFDQGLAHFDGERALIYVRSRHAEGDEGSDFARGKRQQEVVAAMMQKIRTPNTWSLLYRNFDAIVSLMTSSITTDLSTKDILALCRIFLLHRNSTFSNVSLEPALMNPPESQYGGRYVLIPKKGEDLHAYIEASLSGRAGN